MQKIGGATVDADDPCQVLAALQLVRTKLAAGESVEEFSIQSPTTRETVRFSPAKPAFLEQEIQRYSRLCSEKQGQRRCGRRWRFRF
ncbi:hypothetical protein [Agrobacterium tumefaciens]|uniref:hypothetical protein n=1 Tax=Agrobacterium tumefaciens TaxID=358 RepID=UPI0021CF13AB|nr:hypothetical protein [Agrobacterium tumefaciens]UXS04462.1 hypothetical protein FY156_23650 [Agrobacterium tumefaciens]